MVGDAVRSFVELWGDYFRERDDSDLANGMKYRIALSLSWTNSICNPETGITRIRGK